MKRYFYTDPLAAVWMEQHHGVRTENLADGYFSAWQCVYFDADHYRSGTLPPDYHARFSICLECLHLLRPQSGDIVQWLIKDGRGGFIPGAGAFGVYETYGDIESIIKRNGLAFHWPESEAA